MNPDQFLATVSGHTTLTSEKCGEVYQGEVDASHKRCGKGVLRWPNGNCYFGEWRDGCMSGQGTFQYAVEGDTYTGGFQEDKKAGRGRYEFGNGNFYDGDFNADRRHGSGRYVWTCGDSYDGGWVDGHMHGKGTTVYSNGNVYVGDFFNDRREGTGTLTCADGLRYDGSWVKNTRHGKGTLSFPSGDSYEGEWANDKKDGFGVDTFGPGNVFKGRYSNNVKCGRGTMAYGNGDLYEGEWVDDKMHGQGKYDFASGFSYEGSWANNARHGRGVYVFANGNRYEGGWAEDKRHGKGCLTADGVTYEGTWDKGKMSGPYTVGISHDLHFTGSYSKGVAVAGCFVYGPPGQPHPVKVRGEFLSGSKPLPSEEPLPLLAIHPQAVLQRCSVSGRLALAPLDAAVQPPSIFERLLAAAEKQLSVAHSQAHLIKGQIPPEVSVEAQRGELEALQAQLRALSEGNVRAPDHSTEEMEKKLAQLRADLRKQVTLVESFRKACAKFRQLKERQEAARQEMEALAEHEVVSVSMPRYERDPGLVELEGEVVRLKGTIGKLSASLKAAPRKALGTGGSRPITNEAVVDQERATVAAEVAACRTAEAVDAHKKNAEAISAANERLVMEVAATEQRCLEVEGITAPSVASDVQPQFAALEALQQELTRYTEETVELRLQACSEAATSRNAQFDRELVEAESALSQAEDRLRLARDSASRSAVAGKMRRKSSSLIANRPSQSTKARNELVQEVGAHEAILLEEEVAELRRGASSGGGSYALSDDVGREACFNQLIKERATQERLNQQHRQLEESAGTLKNSLPTVHDILISIDDSDWKLAYLAEQVRKRQATVAELQLKEKDVRRLEAMIAASRGTV